MFRTRIITEVNNGRIRKVDAQKLNETLQKWNGDVEITVGLPKEFGSNRQNNYYWGVIIKILSEGLGYEREEMHEVLKSQLGYKDHKQIVNKETGEVTDIEYIRGYSSYTVQEREEYHEACRRFGSELGYNIPEPNEVESE